LTASASVAGIGEFDRYLVVVTFDLIDCRLSFLFW